MGATLWQCSAGTDLRRNSRCCTFSLFIYECSSDK